MTSGNEPEVLAATHGRDPLVNGHDLRSRGPAC
jgi:hypothetical protein